MNYLKNLNGLGNMSQRLPNSSATNIISTRGNKITPAIADPTIDPLKSKDSTL